MPSAEQCAREVGLQQSETRVAEHRPRAIARAVRADRSRLPKIALTAESRHRLARLGENGDEQRDLMVRIALPAALGQLTAVIERPHGDNAPTQEVKS